MTEKNNDQRAFRAETVAAHENCTCVPEGWKLVPVEPTWQMIDAGRAVDKEYSYRQLGPECGIHCADCFDHWAVMLAAAPAAPTEGARDVAPPATPVDTTPMYKALMESRIALLAVNSGASQKAIALIDAVLNVAPERDISAALDDASSQQDEREAFNPNIEDPAFLAAWPEIQKAGYDYGWLGIGLAAWRSAQQAQADAGVGTAVEDMIAACVPGGSICDPQVVADAIRGYFSAQPAPATGDEAIAEQDARFAIDGAIAYGRTGTNEPPAGHWLTEYWHIGRQLAKLGETSAWDNQTPVDKHYPFKRYAAMDEAAKQASEEMRRLDDYLEQASAAHRREDQRDALGSILGPDEDGLPISRHSHRAFGMQSHPSGTWVRYAEVEMRIAAIQRTRAKKEGE